jgi:oligopeptide transport system permease protein
MFIGVLYGGIAGSIGGVTDEILMRIADIIYSIPYLIIVILLTVVMGNNEFTLILALAVSDWTGMARIVRAQAFQLKNMEFVQYAKALGGSYFRVLFKHILPNCTGTITVGVMFSIPAAVFAEAFLSFIGLGVRIPKASLGTLASDGYRYMDSHPWLFWIPVAVIIMIMLLFNIIGDRIRDLTDPKCIRH